MIITEKVFLKMNNKWIRHFWNKGYECKQYDVIEVKVEDLTENSHAKISVKCDMCGKISNIKYQGYNTSIKNGGYYACSKKCGNNKYVNTNIERYGVTNTTKLQDVKIKMEKTNRKKYGTKAPSQNKEIMDKMKNTCMKRYGVDCALKNEVIKNKISNTRIMKGIQLPLKEKTQFEK